MRDRHLSWSNLELLIDSGAPARRAIAGEPGLELMIEAGSSSLSLLVPNSVVSVFPSSSLEAIQIGRITIDDADFVRIFSRERPLFQDFYLFLTEVADSIQVDHEQLDEALRKRLDNWKQLLRSVGLLSVEQQLGLIGELWVLNRLIAIRGSEALDTWTGPLAEPHDFRFTGIELEVKATRNRQRIHIINGLEQLVPSANQKLYILSLQFEPASTTDSWSLPQMVSSTRANLQIDPARQRTFDRLIGEGCSYRVSDEQHYQCKFRLRTKAALVHVDDHCPKITRELVRQTVGTAAEQRILEVRYSVDLEGLGVVDGSPDFLATLPAAPGN
jgi:hypothetical protein